MIIIIISNQGHQDQTLNKILLEDRTAFDNRRNSKAIPILFHLEFQIFFAILHTPSNIIHNL